MSSDPGYGDPNAPIGTAEWAKRWRLGFQSVVKDLPDAPRRSVRYFQLGNEHRAWTLLTKADGKTYYRDFDEFCKDGQPWGLGVDPTEFRAYLAAELGEKAAGLATVSPGSQGERTDLEGTSDHRDPKSKGMSEPKEKRLRAILRAPEVVQDLYRTGLINQDDATKMGPKSPTPEQAASIAEARQELERLDRQAPPREFRSQAKKVVADRLGKADPTGLDQLRKAWARATEEERNQFLMEVNAE